MKLQKQVTWSKASQTRKKWANLVGGVEEKKNDIINQLDNYEKEKSYKSMVKTDKEYMWHPVYEIEFSNGLKILWAKVDGKLIQLKPRERLYKDVVNDRLAKWMWDSTTKTRNKWRQSYWDKYWFPEVDR